MSPLAVFRDARAPNASAFSIELVPPSDREQFRSGSGLRASGSGSTTVPSQPPSLLDICPNLTTARQTTIPGRSGHDGSSLSHPNGAGIPAHSGDPPPECALSTVQLNREHSQPVPPHAE